MKDKPFKYHPYQLISQYTLEPLLKGMIERLPSVTVRFGCALTEFSQDAEGVTARVRNLDVGLVFQSFNLIGDMTVYENVEYPLAVRGVSEAERRQRVDAALERVGLSSRAKLRPASLSGGHQQLVAVARAITGRPAILLADEPTGNLDSKAGEALMQMFNELHAGGATVCVVTHDPRWLEQVQRHIYLFDGKIVDKPES